MHRGMLRILARPAQSWHVEGMGQLAAAKPAHFEPAHLCLDYQKAAAGFDKRHWRHNHLPLFSARRWVRALNDHV
jgi:hypothetical protein